MTTLTGAQDPPAYRTAAAEFNLSPGERLWLITRVFLVSTLLTLEAWGVYTVGFESRVPLQFHVSSFHLAAYLNGQVATNTALWHYFVPNAFVRHGIRKLIEATFASVFAMAYGLNPYKLRSLEQARSKWNALDWFEIRVLHAPNFKDNDWRRQQGLQPVSGGQLLIAAGLTLLVFTVSAGSLLYFAYRYSRGLSQLNVPAFGPGPTHFLQELWTGPVIYTAIGLAISPLVKRYFAPVFDDFQEVLANQWVARNRPFSWYHRYVLFTPQFCHRIELVAARGGQRSARNVLAGRSRGFKVGAALAVLIFLTFLIVGAYVRLHLLLTHSSQ